jgi:hypothetical protein
LYYFWQNLISNLKVDPWYGKIRWRGITHMCVWMTQWAHGIHPHLGLLCLPGISVNDYSQSAPIALLHGVKAFMLCKTDQQKDSLLALQDPFSNSADIKMCKRTWQCIFGDLNHIVTTSHNSRGKIVGNFCHCHQII